MWLFRLLAILVLISLFATVVEAIFITFPILLPIIVVVLVIRYFKNNPAKFDNAVDGVNKVLFKKTNWTTCSICNKTMYASDGVQLVDGVICQTTANQMTPLVKDRFRMRVSDVQEQLDKRRDTRNSFSTGHVQVIYNITLDKDEHGVSYDRIVYDANNRIFRFIVEHPETKKEQFEFVSLMDIEEFNIELLTETESRLTPSTFDIFKAEKMLRGESTHKLTVDEQSFYGEILSHKNHRDPRDAFHHEVKISKDSYYFYLVVTLKDPFMKDIYVRLNKRHVFKDEHQYRFDTYVKSSSKLLEKLFVIMDSEK